MGLRAFLGRLVKLRPVEETQIPQSATTANPYKKGWPLAQAWDRGFGDAIQGRGTPKGGSTASWEGFSAGKAYICSGDALRARQAKLAR